MYKIIRTEIIAGLFTVDIEGQLKKAKFGDVLHDENNNAYILKSIALKSGNFGNYNHTLVLKIPDNNFEIGKLLFE